MLVAGDEFGRTQKGNNNAYCQDNEISWVDWEGIDERGKALTAFVRKLLYLRAALPVLRRGRFLSGEYNEELGVHEMRWLSPDGTDLTQEQWGDGNMRCFGMVLDGRAQVSGIRKTGSDATLLMVFNSYHDVVDFTLPDIPGDTVWINLIDTNQPTRDELPQFETGDVYQVTGRSTLLFALRAKGAMARVYRDLAELLTTDGEDVELAE